MKFSFKQINDSTLIAPAILTIYKEPEQKISTTQLLKKLRENFILPQDQKRILKGRKDDVFSQKVRNINSHKTLEKNNLAYMNNNYISLSREGINIAKLLNKKLENLSLIDEETIESLREYKNLLYQYTLKVPFNPIYIKKLINANFSARCMNLFKQLKLTYVGDLVQISERDIIKHPKAGKITLKEIVNYLNDLGLKLNTKVDHWEKDNINQYDKILYQAQKKEFKKDLDALIKSAFQKFKVEKKNIKSIEREQQVIFSRVGIDQEFLSLQEIGNKFNVSRERIRQISSKFLKKIKEDREIQYKLSKLKNFINNKTPISEITLNEYLLKEEFFSSYKSLPCLKNIFTLLFGKYPYNIYYLRHKEEVPDEFESISFLTKNKEEEKLLDKLLSLSRKYTRRYSYVNFNKLMSDNFKSIHRNKFESIKSSFRENKYFFWFDDDNYSVLDSKVGSVINILKKLIFINKKITYGTLSEALINNYRINASPPTNLLKKICKLHGFHCDEDYIYDDGIESTLSPLDNKLIKMFKENGPFLNFYQCFDFAEKYQIKLGSLFAFLYSSSIIKNLDDNVFCLFGTENDPEKITEAKNYFDKKKFKEELNLRCNWQKDGSILMEFNLHKVMKIRGFLFIPAGFEKHLDGEYLIQLGGRLTNNIIKVNNHVIWNLQDILKDFKENKEIKINFSFKPNIAKINEQ